MSESARRENRRHQRFAAKAKVILRWQESNGLIRTSYGIAEDISRTGLRLSMEKKVPVQGIVNVECRDLQIAGVAQIRHSRKDGHTYSVSVEFLGGLEWRQSERLLVN